MKLPNIKNKIKIDYLGWATLIVIILTTSIISRQLSKLRTDIQIQSITKVTVKDNEQLDKLCKQFQTQWNSTNYALYIYQPNSPVKTHKELANSDIGNELPLRLPLSDYQSLNKNKIEFGGVDQLTDFKDYSNIGKSYVRIPIYQYSVIVAELFLFYDDTNKINSSMFGSMMVESQIIEQLLR